MAEEPDESIWKARLRWKLRGAWQGPAFVGFTLLESILLNRLPVAGDEGLDVVGGFLLCGFMNLVVVGLFAPVVARVLQHRRPSRMPLAVRQDKVGTTLMGVLAGTLLVLGILHSSAVAQSEREFDQQLQAVRRYVLNQAPPEFHAGLGAENVWKQNDEFFRTCVPGPDPRRSLCLYVDTAGVPTVVRDPDQQSNSRIAGPDNAGRRGG